MPVSLHKDPVAVKKWRELVKVLGTVPGWITVEMAGLMERYALTYSQMVRCELYVRANGDTYESEFIHNEGKDNEVLVKSRKRHPETLLLKEARIELLHLEGAIGMGPVYRTKVDLSSSEDAHDDVLEG